MVGHENQDLLGRREYLAGNNHQLLSAFYICSHLTCNATCLPTSLLGSLPTRRSAAQLSFQAARVIAGSALATPPANPNYSASLFLNPLPLARYDRAVHVLPSSQK